MGVVNHCFIDSGKVGTYVSVYIGKRTGQGGGGAMLPPPPFPTFWSRIIIVSYINYISIMEFNFGTVALDLSSSQVLPTT